RQRGAAQREQARAEIGNEAVPEEEVAHGREAPGRIRRRGALRGEFSGPGAHSSSPSFFALTVIGSFVSGGISGRINVQPLRSFIDPPHSVSRSVSTIGSSMSFFGT